MNSRPSQGCVFGSDGLNLPLPMRPMRPVLFTDGGCSDSLLLNTLAVWELQNASFQSGFATLFDLASSKGQ